MQLEELLTTLIAFRTVTSDKQEINRLFLWIRDVLSEVPVFFQEFNSQGCQSLLITTRKTKTPRLWLAGHIDVVPGSDAMFTPYTQDGHLYGRGIFDMKYGVATYIQLLLDMGLTVKDYDFGLMITSDEETGGAHGIKALLEQGYTSNACVLPDGGSNWQLIVGAKGVWQIKIISTGKSAHASKPWLGRSAILTLVDFLHAVGKKMDLHNPVNADGATTINIGIMKGGNVANQVADHAEAILDVRFPSEKDRLYVQASLLEIARSFPSIRIEEESCEQSFIVNAHDPMIQKFESIALRHLKEPMEHAITYGTSDARFFAAKSIPTVILRPRGGGHHTSQEWINVEDVHVFYRILKEYVTSVSKL